MVRMVCIDRGEITQRVHCTQLAGVSAMQFAQRESFCNFFGNGAEKTWFRFDPAHPRPNSASADARKYILPVFWRVGIKIEINNILISFRCFNPGTALVKTQKDPDAVPYSQAGAYLQYKQIQVLTPIQTEFT